MSKMEEIHEMYLNLKKKINEKENAKEKWQFYCPLILKIENLLEETGKNSKEYINSLMMLGYANYEKSRLLVEIDDMSSLENLEKAIEMLKNYKNHEKFVYIYLKIINLYSFLQSKKGSLETAKNELLEVENLYNTIEKKENVEIYSLDEVFKYNSVKKQNAIKLEKLVTNNLQMLSWIYNKLNLQESFVLYHHKVLQRQLEYKDGSALLWVQKCARLSSYFLSKQRFREARHHLAAALIVLQEYEKDIKHDQQFLEDVEDLQQYHANIARYWVKYGLFLINSSRTKLKNAENINTDMSKGDVKDDELEKNIPNQKFIKEKCLLFPSLNLSEIESKVTCEYISTTNQARLLFIFCHNWLKKSKEYYTIQEHTLDYVNLILDLSELYRYLALYEQDIDSQYNVQKRRMEVLETLSAILKDVRPSCYVAVSIELFRELTEVQIELLALNVDKFCHMNESLEVQNYSMVREYNEKKLETISDIFVKIEAFQNRLKQKKYFT